MEEADALAIELKAVEAALTSAQAEITRDRQALEHERATVDDDLKRVSEERARTAALVGGELLALFDRVAHGRSGLAMAEARDGLCTVCHVRLRPQVFNQVRRNDRHHPVRQLHPDPLLRPVARGDAAPPPPDLV